MLMVPRSIDFFTAHCGKLGQLTIDYSGMGYRPGNHAKYSALMAYTF